MSQLQKRSRTDFGSIQIEERRIIKGRRRRRHA
jgi:hypothetical protein